MKFIVTVGIQVTSGTARWRSRNFKLQDFKLSKEFRVTRRCIRHGSSQLRADLDSEPSEAPNHCRSRRTGEPGRKRERYYLGNGEYARDFPYAFKFSRGNWSQAVIELDVLGANNPGN